MLPAFNNFICSRSRRSPSVLPLKTAPRWRVRRFAGAEEVRQDWPQAQRDDAWWLRPAVLGFLIEQPQGVTTEPVVLHHTDGRRVLLTTQTFYFSAAGQVSDVAKGETSGYDLRRRLLAPFSFRVLCLGQFLVSGSYAGDGLGDLPPAEAATVLDALAETLMVGNHSYAGVIVKDLFPQASATTRTLIEAGYYQLPTDPQFGMDLPAHWTTFDDYLADLKSKYRVRYRRARRQLVGLRRRVLSVAEVDRYRERIYALYQTTSAGSNFNAVSLTPAYFAWLAGTEGASLQGYFGAAGELVGFTSTVANGETLHAHFIGLETAYKASHYLYHNLLFDLLDDAIAGRFRRLDYGRTAAEIKTSVGAAAERPACLLRARSGLINRLVPVFTPAVYRRADWTPRNPLR